MLKKINQRGYSYILASLVGVILIIFALSVISKFNKSSKSAKSNINVAEDINSNKTRLFPYKVEYSNAGDFVNGLATVKIEDYECLIDKTGKLINGNGWESVRRATQDVAVVNFGNSYGLVDVKGEYIIDPSKSNFNYIGLFSEGLAPVKIGYKYGFIDKTGKVVIGADFELANSFSEGVAWVKFDDRLKQIPRWDLIDKTGKTLLTTNFYEVENFSEGLASVLTQEGKYGFIDKSGNFAIKAQFDRTNSFSDGLARVKINDKYGFINKLGKMVLEANLEDVTAFSEGLAGIKLNGKWGFVDLSAKVVIAPQFEAIRMFSDGLAAVKLDGRWGFIGKSGHFVVNPKFDAAKPFSDGVARVNISNGELGFIDKKGKFLIRDKIYIPYEIVDGIGKMTVANKVGFINKYEQLKFFSQLEYSKGFSNGIAEMALQGDGRDDRQVFFIDKKGKIVKDIQEFKQEDFPEGLKAVNEDIAIELQTQKHYKLVDSVGRFTLKPIEKEDLRYESFKEKPNWGFIDQTGKNLISSKFYYAEDFSEGLAIAVVLSSKRPSHILSCGEVIMNYNGGFIDKTGKFVISPQYKNLGSFSENLAWARIEDKNNHSNQLKTGFINKKGDWVIPPQFGETKNFSEGLAAVATDFDGYYSNNNWGFVDKTGKVVIPLQFNRVESFSEGLAAVEVNEKWGFIDKTGKFVIEPQFAQANSFSEGLAGVIKNGNWVFIDKTGKIVVNPLDIFHKLYANEFKKF